MNTDRTRSPRRVIVAGLLLVGALSGLALGDLDISIGNNTVIDAQLDPAGEVETFRFTAAGGSKVSITAKAKPEKKATPVGLSVVVLDAGDQVVATGVSKGKTTKVRGFVPPASGTFRIVVTGDGATTGAYQLKAKWKAPTRVKTEIQVGMDDVAAPFAAAPGSTATVKVKAAKGSPALPRLARIASQDDVFEFVAFQAPKEGAKSQKQKNVALGPQRDYEVLVQNVGAEGGVLVDVALKSPKPAKVSVDVRDPSIGGGTSTGASGGKPAVAFGGVVGPEGGAVTADPLLAGLLGGTGISVPAGALASPVAITFGAAVNGLPSPDGGVDPLGPTVFFGPEGLEFGIPATVTIPFDVGALAAGVDTVEIYARDEDGTVTLIPPPYVFDVDAGTCSFPASHFTSFRAFERVPPFLLVNERAIVPQSAQAGDRVGAAVALDQDTLVIGAPDDDAQAANAGAVHVYVRNGTAWQLQTTLYATDPVADGAFGADVALVGDELFAGSPGAQTRGLATGAVYYFGRFQGQWSLYQRLDGNQTDTGSRFGEALDFDGTTLVVGAPGETPGTGQDSAGAVYTFEPLDGFLETEWLTQTSPVAGQEFGADVALCTNDRIVVGAPGASLPGRAFVYERDPQQQFGVQWSVTAELAHGETAGEEDFGAAVDGEGDAVVVGDPAFDETGAIDAGRAFVFRFGTAWNIEDKLVPSAGQRGAAFGTSVTLQQDLIVVGEPGRDASAAATDAGAVHLFYEQSRTWGLVIGRFADTPTTNEGLGAAVHLVGTELAVGGVGSAPTTGAVLLYDVMPTFAVGKR